MKTIYILFIFLILGCTDEPKEKTKTESEVKDTLVEKVPITTIQKSFTDPTFHSIIKNLSIRKTPIVDSTTFDSYKDDFKIYTKEEVTALQLEKIYPNFYKEGYNYKATPSYKLEFSEEFYSAVIVIFKGENEMESQLINYNIDGNIIDAKVIAYHETAEGVFQRKSKIENNIITTTYIDWMDEKKETIEVFEITENGNIKPVITDSINTTSQESELFEKVVQQLGLEKTRVHLEGTKISSASINELIMVLSELAEEYDDDDEAYGLNSHIVIVNPKNGKVIKKFSESSKTNGWFSDAVFIDGISIDTTNYRLSESKSAFGVILKHRTQSQPNPYNTSTLSLFMKDEFGIQKILDNYTIYESIGEVNLNACNAEFSIIDNSLVVDNVTTNELFDLVIKTKNTQRIFAEDKNGECNPIDSILSQKDVILKFDGKIYKEIKR
ncbi:hypothetical protein [uncultured Aquimarina sp.]|uniref:hypothetical protein n=1 Tax=uncultured Aquimarina sp. TaxID=575652 RepID=UPI002616E6C4|nr:hypothetical protein [uncultured Aquimarina sp.]